MLNGRKRKLVLNQSHDSICESHNPFHDLGINIKALNDTIELNYCIDGNISIKNRDVSFTNLDMNFDTCLRKIHSQHFENKFTSVDLKTKEENQSSTLESMITNEIHLDSSKDHKMASVVENKQYNSSKYMEERIKAMTIDLESKNQSDCKKRKNPRGKSSSQILHYEAMTKTLSEENANGSSPYCATTIYNNSQDSNAKPKENEVKPTGKHFYYIKNIMTINSIT